MVRLVVTPPHRATHEPLERSKLLSFRTISYDRLLAAHQLPRATYVFADMDRLGFWDLELAARVFRQLTGAGVRALNDPARVLQRVALLRTLRSSGINSFAVARVEDGEAPARFPVFLRTQSAHRGPLSGLLPDRAAADAAVAAALADGVPLRELVLVEYRAEPVRDGLFRKLSVFRVGDRMVPSISVHESKWSAKSGERGSADAALYEEELAIVTRNRFGEAIRPAFEAGGIEYGRADFGLVAGRPEIYEINTNPKISVVVDHPFPVRIEASRLCLQKLEEAFAAVDTPAGGAPIALDDPELKAQRWNDRWRLTGSRWSP